MPTKAEYIADFLRRIASIMEEEGYLSPRKGVFQKAGGYGLSFVLKYEFVGSGLVEAVPYFGVRLESVEERLANFVSIREIGVAPSPFPQTVFDRLDRLSRALTVELPKPINVHHWVDKDFPIEQIRQIESRLSKLLDIAKFCATNNALPLGHHAFRVPFILYDAEERFLCTEYMDRVSRMNVIPKYELFYREFLEGREF